MAAFDRVKCGIDGFDEAFDNIRLGDNVVWQLTSLDDFKYVVDPFVEQAITDKRDIIYIRFATHEPLVEERPEVKRYELNPHEGFETFTVEVRKIITDHGHDAFYVFDCLSELQTAWSADLMMGNFFRVTCPYLFTLDTVAYFPIIRGAHSFSTVAKIRDTTQLLIDVYRDGNELFIHPLKVWNRYGPTMFLAHLLDLESGQVHALTDSVETSRFYACANNEQQNTAERNNDSWDRFFLQAQESYQRGSCTQSEIEHLCKRMCNMMMTKDPRMRKMVRQTFSIEDYFSVRSHMVGTGLVGGKTCGMLLARKIVSKQLPQWHDRIEPHDSFYIGTDVFYTYIVANDAWHLRIDQINEHAVGKAAHALRERLLNGVFPEDIRSAFGRILDYFRQTPIIVRSSSFLEDGFGNAFAGKYESVFCPNIGSYEQCLEDFENAVRRVYASTMDPSALEYRYRNGLDAREEQMALLVQRVSGSRLPNGMFMPTAAGVGYSHSAYCWMQDMDPEAGMLRIVAGLGTRAVDRTDLDYPRIISLDRPRATTAKNVAEKHRFSQHFADAIDLQQHAFVTLPVGDLAKAYSPAAMRAVFEHDSEAEELLRDRGRSESVLFASCEGLTANREFCTMMHDILTTLQKAYEYPVDIEFTVNVGEDGSFVVNLLQCRPLKALERTGRVDLPTLDESSTLFHIRGVAMGNARTDAVNLVVEVDPHNYYTCPHMKKSQVAGLVGRVNTRVKETGETCLLLSPGRIGTSSPELGVPVSFANISEFSGICEVAYSQAGYAPELSYGSHLFQDLVEDDIFYGALLEDPEKRLCYHPELLKNAHDITEDVIGQIDDPDMMNIVRVYDTTDMGLTLWHSMLDNESICGIAPDK